MTHRMRRTWGWIVVGVMLATAAWPGATATTQEVGGGTRVITGSYETRNPIWPTIGADTRIALYDATGNVLLDFDFTSPPAAQVLGQLDGDIVSGTYQIVLPEVPQGTLLDFDGDESTPPAVQVFAAATYIDYLGDEYINRGETPLNLSVIQDPMTYEITGGALVVWTEHAGEQFPNGAGADGAMFTGDEPLMTLPAGWSVVELDAESFTVVQDNTVDIPIIESIGQLHDYSDMDYQAAWEALYARARETYPFTEDKRLDWDAIYAEITPLVQQAQSDLDFHLIIARFGGLIPDTHIGYSSLPVMQTFLLGGVGIGQLLVTDDEQLVVADVAPGSPAAEAGVAVGDVLVEVDGIPALRSLDQTPMLVSSASTKHGRRFFQAALMLQGPVGSQVALTWRQFDGTEVTRRFTRVFDVRPLLLIYGGEILLQPVISSHMLDSGLGYISVRGFAEEVSLADAWFRDDLENLIQAGARGIVIDLRYNYGGLAQLAMSMSGRFFQDYARLSDFYYADGRGDFTYRGFIEILSGQPHYDGPVAVLVNEMTGSAGDMFVYAMQSDGRALIVGHTPTGGFTGEISDGRYLLPGNLEMQIPTGRSVDPETREVLLEGVGVIPDIQVPRTVESIRSPEDEVLTAAEAALLAP
jgi:C-terminal processing protease CtpA/Prc